MKAFDFLHYSHSIITSMEWCVNIFVIFHAAHNASHCHKRHCMLSDHMVIVRITLDPTEDNMVACVCIQPLPPFIYTTLELDLLMQTSFFFK